MPRSPFIALAATAALALALAACGSSSKSTSTAGSAAASSSPTTTSSAPATAPSAFLSQATKVSTLGSTVPPNGDVNPYGLVMVPTSVGKLQARALLVSNFNDKANNQGTGTTIMQITPSGKRSVFANITARGLPGSCPGGVGLTTALSVLPGG
jgi:hypothetical protein